MSEIPKYLSIAHDLGAKLKMPCGTLLTPLVEELEAARAEGYEQGCAVLAEAVKCEREACAKVCDGLHYKMAILGDYRSNNCDTWS